jgi:hypothetical protein
MHEYANLGYLDLWYATISENDILRTLTGSAKTHLQHLATAAAMNLARTIHWLMEGESQRSCSPFAALAPN